MLEQPADNADPTPPPGAEPDIAEHWSGITRPQGSLDSVRQAVMAAYLAHRGKPGNAGDYLRAALDSIADAQAVTR